MTAAQQQKLDDMEARNYVFVHIPKTAGRAVLDALGLSFCCEHCRIQDYVDKLGEDTVRRRFKFTTVRNPWERAVSWYAFFMPMLPDGQPKSFRDWLTQAYRHQSKKFPGQRRFLDQMSYTTIKSGEVLIDYFMRFETIDQDFAVVADRLGVTSALPMVTDSMKSDAVRSALKVPLIPKDYREMYSVQELIDMVAEIDSETIDRFGYVFK